MTDEISVDLGAFFIVNNLTIFDKNGTFLA